MTQDHDLGLFLEGLPLEPTVEFARAAESAGFQNVWIPEITFGDAFVPGTAVAGATEDIGIATGVVGIWSRSPVAMALSAATLHQYSGERLVLGLGLQARSYVNNWHGRVYEQPLQAMREYLSIIRPILAGELVTYEGEIFHVRGFQLMMPPVSSPAKIYLAAVGPRMVQLAGELADGVLGYFWSLEYVRDVVFPNLEIGAKKADRSLDDFDVVCGFPSIITPDDAGLQQVKGQVVMFSTALGSSPSYATSISAAGFGSALERIQELVAAADLAGAVACVSDEMASSLTISGSPDHARARITAYQDAGITTVALNPAAPGGYYPLFEGHFPDEAELPEFSFPAYLDAISDVIEAFKD